MTPLAVAWVLGGVIAGLIAGSFIATLVLRWPQSRGLGGRSQCDGCHRPLSTVDLIPVLSYVFLRGRCRTCDAKIDVRHVTIEVLAAVIGGCALAASPDSTGVAGALFGWQLLALAALDFEHFWLPDRLTGLLALSGLAFALGEGRDTFVDRLIGGAAGFAVLFVIAWSYKRLRGRTGLGAGDPKLLCAIGLWLGWQPLPIVLVGASGVGLAAVLLMRLRGQAVAADTRLPLGTLMAIAAFPVWLSGP